MGVADDVVVDRRDLDAADGADHLLAALGLDHLTGEIADEAARLVRGVDEALDVLDALRLREVGALDRVVGDREVDVRELRRDLRERRREQVSGRRDDVRTVVDRGHHVRQVVRARVRLQRDRLHAELGLRPVETGQLVLVEALVVELADVADQGGRERALRRRARDVADDEHCDRAEPDGRKQWFPQLPLLVTELAFGRC